MTLRRLHSLTGVLALGPYLLFHLWVNSAALSGRESWFDRARWVDSRIGFEVRVFLAVSLAVHLLLCLSKPAAPDLELLGRRGLLYLQRATGAAVLLFIAFHVYQLRLPQTGPELLARGAYDLLWSELGKPFPLLAYTVGVTAVCFHLAHGLSRAAVTWGLATTAKGALRARYLAGAFGFLLWGLILHLLGHFAVGQGLFG